MELQQYVVQLVNAAVLLLLAGCCQLLGLCAYVEMFLQSVALVPCIILTDCTFSRCACSARVDPGGRMARAPEDGLLLLIELLP